MASPMSSPGPAIPARAAIVWCTLTVVSLAGLARYADHRARQLHAWKASFAATSDEGGFEPVDLATTDDLEGELAKFAPLAGFGPLAPPTATDTDEELDPRSPEAVRAARPEGWTYPTFDRTVRGAKHGPPPGATPRNATLNALDGNGEPLSFDALTAIQRGPDGDFFVNAYRTSDDPTAWAIGSPSISTGEYVRFELEGAANGVLWKAEASAGSIAPGGSVELGVVHFERRE